MELRDKIEEIFEEVVGIRRRIHQYPELGFQEYRTQSLVMESLEVLGIEHHPVARTGVLGIIRGKAPGKVVALRADMDALPLTEETKVPYASKNKGVMHACGHDAHTAMLLGIAKILEAMKEEFEGTVKLFFQPAEETDGGAVPMIEAGVMENPRVDYSLGLHVMPQYPVGVVGLKYGKMNASTDTIEIRITGRGGHGAYPHQAVDAIVIAGHVITALQSVVSRTVSPLDAVVLSFGKISGGTAENIIAAEVVLTGTLRTLDEKVRKEVKERLTGLVADTCRAHGGRGETRVKEGYNALVNDDEVVDLIRRNAVDYLGESGVVIAREPSLGAEDFSFFLNHSRGAFFVIGCGNEEKGIRQGLHHPAFDLDEACLKTGIALQVMNTLSLLGGSIPESG
ncbi:MAG: peptidase M20 [delta proteobacterium ML8_F1]|nr:MAG: peptidase M20 [delta proteobacterium ML8_F1]